MNAFLCCDRMLSVFYLEHLINPCLESRILADRQFIRQILDECTLFVKHCVSEWKCEDSKGTECKVYMMTRFSYTDQSPLIGHPCVQLFPAQEPLEVPGPGHMVRA